MENKLTVHFSSSEGVCDPLPGRMKRVESSARECRCSATIAIFFCRRSSGLRWIPLILTSGISSSSEEYPLRPSFAGLEIPFVKLERDISDGGSTRSVKEGDLVGSGRASATSAVETSISKVNRPHGG
jgi:hypothetical protein